MGSEGVAGGPGGVKELSTRVNSSSVISPLLSVSMPTHQHLQHSSQSIAIYIWSMALRLMWPRHHSDSAWLAASINKQLWARSRTVVVGHPRRLEVPDKPESRELSASAGRLQWRQQGAAAVWAPGRATPAGSDSPRRPPGGGVHPPAPTIALE